MRNYGKRKSEKNSVPEKTASAKSITMVGILCQYDKMCHTMNEVVKTDGVVML